MSVDVFFNTFLQLNNIKSKNELKIFKISGVKKWFLKRWYCYVRSKLFEFGRKIQLIINVYNNWQRLTFFCWLKS